MLGKKVRSFAPLPRDISLEELVPEDNFYRRLERTLDPSLVRELVGPLYAGGGRPSVDPVVFFKLQLVMFFENLRSERQLMGVKRSWDMFSSVHYRCNVLYRPPLLQKEVRCQEDLRGLLGPVARRNRR